MSAAGAGKEGDDRLRVEGSSRRYAVTEATAVRGAELRRL